MVCDYSKGKIYTIRSLTDNNVYIGSTIQSLSTRMSGHRSKYKKNEGLGLNKDIVKDINDWYIELYDFFPCNEKCELLKKEGEIIRLIGTLNKNIAGRKMKEYNKEYRIDHIDYYKQYRIDNADKMKEYQKQYKIDNVEKMKQYRIDNAKKLKQYHKQWYQKKINKKMIC